MHVNSNQSWGFFWGFFLKWRSDWVPSPRAQRWECFCLVKLTHTLGPCPAVWQHHLPGLKDGMSQQRSDGGPELSSRWQPPLLYCFKRCRLCSLKIIFCCWKSGEGLALNLVSSLWPSAYFAHPVCENRLGTTGLDMQKVLSTFLQVAGDCYQCVFSLPPLTPPSHGRRLPLLNLFPPFFSC